jgi:transposase
LLRGQHKNALFAGSDGDADRWAIVASLIETAKLNGIEPFAWLRDMLTRLVDGHPKPAPRRPPTVG